MATLPERLDRSILRVRGGSIVTASHRNVFSAYAEVVPYCGLCHIYSACILRVRGGSSNSATGLVELGEYSPRTRR